MSVPSKQALGPLVEPKTVGEPTQRIEGRYVVLEHLEPEHVKQIWQLIDGQEALWTYMLEGPFADQEAFAASLQSKRTAADPYTYAVLDRHTGQAQGYLALMHWNRGHRSVEIGHVLFAKPLQRTRAATEAIYLIMRHAFSDTLNMRRVEWKCNAFNAPSKRAAERLGFTYEGTFRNHYIVKGRSRDSAWFSILDSEWPVVQAGLDAWLAPDNFDQHGQQRKGLVELRQHFLSRPDNKV